MSYILPKLCKINKIRFDFLLSIESKKQLWNVVKKKENRNTNRYEILKYNNYDDKKHEDKTELEIEGVKLIEEKEWKENRKRRDK